jgi:hypothetical protein
MLSLDVASTACSLITIRPHKLYFTMDGKSRINKATPIAYYMALKPKASLFARSIITR